MSGNIICKAVVKGSGSNIPLGLHMPSQAYYATPTAMDTCSQPSDVQCYFTTVIPNQTVTEQVAAVDRYMPVLITWNLKVQTGLNPPVVIKLLGIC
ncbi:Hypothetical predicted protein [Olea europaea subsp. europaea]|uniref:Uncharacterized protein n=1 Tax=Olea europaea subsp. europaea TaxID=158383 RepID=A0A8S0R4E7_OLEEU|nr:Hypothetical predicted protein [Olea europaea subsp. europaea]